MYASKDKVMYDNTSYTTGIAIRVLLQEMNGLQPVSVKRKVSAEEIFVSLVSDDTKTVSASALALKERFARLLTDHIEWAKMEEQYGLVDWVTLYCTGVCMVQYTDIVFELYKAAYTMTYTHVTRMVDIHERLLEYVNFEMRSSNILQHRLLNKIACMEKEETKDV